MNEEDNWNDKMDDTDVIVVAMMNVTKMDDAKNVDECFKDDVTEDEEDDGVDKMDDIIYIWVVLMYVNKIDDAKNVDEWFKDDEDDGMTRWRI